MRKSKSIQISIPQPCHEDWNKMTPTEQGRFCNTCQKCVVDFTDFTDKQLFEYFKTHTGEKICGQVNNNQLNRVILPTEPRATNFRKYYALIGLTITLLEYPVKNLFAKAPTNKQVTTHAYAVENDEKTILSIIVLDDNKNPIQDATIHIQTIDSITTTYSTDAQGYCKTELVEGEYSISISHRLYKLYSRKVTINKGIHSLNVLLKRHVADDSVVKMESYKTGGLIDISTYKVISHEDIEKMPTSIARKINY